MLTARKISGNMFCDEKFKSIKTENPEILEISRTDLEKNRMRKKTNNGIDIAIVLESNTGLAHGDVLQCEKKTILVEQLPEKILSVHLGDAKIDLAVLIGHIIGNRHRPISIENQKISFPIQSDSELETFEKLFADIIDKIELEIQQEIFRPLKGANVIEH